MKQVYMALAAVLLLTNVFAQSNDFLRSSRSQLNSAQYPFYHGVASGDPLSDRVILWTRITLDPVVDPVQVNWQIATDTTFGTVVNSGSTSTDSSKDYTIKIDATGLQPNTWYYYRFSYDTFKSIIGRTKTVPVGNVNNLRFAVVSCQDYQDGFYNAHRHLSQRNDIDAVLFLGDYTYEGGALAQPLADRIHEPDHKTIQLSEYRIRQSQYHLDPDLQAAHQQYPWICVWDDHETANNSYTNGAKNHNVNDGPWYDRKVNAVKAYQEWIPIRVPDAADTFRVFRHFDFGNLAALNMIDTRLYDRSKQVAPPSGQQFVPANDTMILDSTRTMVGPAQFSWLNNNLDTSTAKWQILGQQVIMTPLVVPAGVLGANAVLINPDQWDGYPFERQKLYDHIVAHNVNNVVVLTGDIHTAWANDLPLPGYDTANRNNSIGVEFVTPSISSGNELPQLVSAPTIYALANYVRYVELIMHGYYVLDITPSRTQSDFVYVSTVSTQSYTTSAGPSWYVNDNEKFLREAGSPSTPLNSYPTPAPVPAISTGIGGPIHNITTVMVQPNPLNDRVLIQYNVFKSEDITLEVWNALGQKLISEKLGRVDAGLNHADFDGSKLSSGYYIIKLKGNNSSVSQRVIKIN